MQNEQEFLRSEVKRLKWEEDISYKMLAEDLLDMNYRSFLNWLHERTNLGYQRKELLKDYINDML